MLSGCKVYCTKYCVTVPFLVFDTIVSSSPTGPECITVCRAANETKPYVNNWYAL